jgi:hypothetical protein
MKLFVLVDKGLSKSQQAVQSAHAVAEFLLRVPGTAWDNGTLVLLKVDDVVPWLSKLQDKPHAYFVEPDLNDKVTAVAATGVDELVQALPLL